MGRDEISRANEEGKKLSIPHSNQVLTHFRHVGLGVKCAKEVATAIRGAIITAKLSIVPVRRGYWGSHIAEPHTVPAKVSGKSGSVMCRLVPARECGYRYVIYLMLTISPRYRYRRCSRLQEDVADGRCPGLLL